MKRFCSCFLIVLLCCVWFFGGCSVNRKQNGVGSADETEATAYYIREESSELAAQTVHIRNSSKKSQVKDLFAVLLSPPDGHVSPLPNDMVLNNLSVEGETAVLDVSKPFGEGDEKRITLGPAALAKTLCSLDYVSDVHIFVNGEEAVGADGNVIGILKGKDLVINKDNAAQAQAPKTTVTLYFGDETAEHLVGERRNVTLSAGGTVEKIIVEELLKGPTEGGHLRTVPQEAKLLSVETKKSVCYVNFSKEFSEKHSGGTAGEMMTVYSIVNSLTELGTVDQVQIFIEGEKRDAFEHIPLNEPISRNKSLIKE